MITSGDKVQVTKPDDAFTGQTGTVLYVDENCGGKLRIEFSGARRATERAHYESSDVEPVICQAFLRCENHATTHIDNLVLGKVPACARCAKILGT